MALERGVARLQDAELAPEGIDAGKGSCEVALQWTRNKIEAMLQLGLCMTCLYTRRCPDIRIALFCIALWLFVRLVLWTRRDR